MPTLGRKKSEAASTVGYDDTESLVVSAGVVTALILAFVAALLVQFGFGDFDRLNFKEAMYDWPNRDFSEFVVYTLQQDGFNFTEDLDRRTTIDVKDTLMSRKYADAYTSIGNRRLETAMELVIPDFPMDRLNAWFVDHFDETTLYVNRANNFFRCSVIATSVLIVAMVASIVAYISLTMSPAREDESGAALEAWKRWGMGFTMGIYWMNGLAMICFLIAVGNALTIQDTFYYHATFMFEMVMYCIVIPTVFVTLGVFIQATRVSTQAAEAENGSLAANSVDFN